jgi:hypothetical protein
MKMRETTMASHGLNGFVLSKISRAIFDLFYDVTGPNGHFSTWGGGEKCSFRATWKGEVGGAVAEPLFAPTGRCVQKESRQCNSKRLQSITF